MPDNQFWLEWKYNSEVGRDQLLSVGNVGNKYNFDNGNTGVLGTPLSWHSMHSRYIIADGEMDISINDPTTSSTPYSASIPKNLSTILKFNKPNIQSISNNIMIWMPYKNNINYTTIDNINWGFNGNLISPTIFESSYVGIDYLLKNTGQLFNTLETKVNHNTTLIDNLSENVTSNSITINDLSRSTGQLFNTLETKINHNTTIINDVSENVTSNSITINDLSRSTGQLFNKLQTNIENNTTIINDVSKNVTSNTQIIFDLSKQIAASTSADVTKLSTRITNNTQLIIDLSKQISNNKLVISDLSKKFNSLSLRITSIEQFLGGAIVNQSPDSEDHIKNIYLGLSKNIPTSSNSLDRWNEISNNSVWRQFL